MSSIAAYSTFQVSSPSNGVLALGVFASIALHGSVIVLVPEIQQKLPAAAEVKVLTATLGPLPARAELESEGAQQPLVWPPEPFRAQAAKPAAAARPVLAPPKRETAPVRPVESASPARQALEPPKPAATASAAPSVQPVPAITAPQTAGLAAVAPMPELPRARDMTQRSVPSATVGAPSHASVSQQPWQPPRADPADSGTVDQYRLSLMGQARRYKRYPSQAMEKGWTGRVDVRLVVGADGKMQEVLVKSSSGYAILDNQAIDMLKKAKPLTPIPPALRGREFSVDVPVIFELTG